jgi:hypothetical protein
MRSELKLSSRRPGNRRWELTWAAVLLLAALPLLAQYDPALQYQNRGNRYEGIKPKPVSGYDIELLSALVAYSEPSSTWPETLRLKFYLPATEDVFVTVRQPRPKTTYYWLDKVVPPAPWRPQAFNEFTWPTAPVLRNLPSVTLDDLGAVVRLRQQDPSKEETIAPAGALSHQATARRERLSLYLQDQRHGLRHLHDLPGRPKGLRTAAEPGESRQSLHLELEHPGPI